MKNIIIKSNSGNHTGFNIKWSIISEHNSIEEAKEKLREYSLCVSDDIIDINGFAFDTNNEEFIYKKGAETFNYDGCRYMFLNENNIDDFGNEQMGYLPAGITF